MKSFLCALSSFIFLHPGFALAEPVSMSIWPGQAPIDRAGAEADAEVKITAHLPKPDASTGAAIVICPGGGYGGLVTGGEGHKIGQWLAGEGIAGIVLEYRLPKGRAEVPLMDAQRAIRTVRSKAAEWKLQTDRIGIMGFSAGGHLAASAAVLHEPGKPDAKDPIEQLSARPDFAILVYPVVSMGEIGHGGSRNNLLGKEPSDDLVKRFSIELQANESSPPIYLAHAVNDTPVPIANSQQLHAALKAKGVETVLLELPEGGHGLNGYKGPMWDAWQSGSLSWLGGLLDIPAMQHDVTKLDPHMTLEQADEKGIAWFDPREKPFRLTGFKWIASDKVYRRLPLKPEWEIRKAVDSLSNSTAGGQIHFQSDSPKILVRVKLPYASGMYHMAATGQSGFDLYIGEPGKQQYYKTARFDAKAATYTVTLFEGEALNRHYTLNFPLYNGVKSVEVGIQAGSSARAPLPFAEEGSIVVYGTSITQGGCASRPGMAYSNILSRRLNREFVNLGFSGNGRGEPALAHLISQIQDKRLIILDYEANASNTLRDTLEPFIDILRKSDANIPILLLTKIHYARDLYHPKNLKAVKDQAAFQKELVERKRMAGDSNLHFMDGGTLLGEHAAECTVDGVHPTDLGFLKMANSLEPVVRKLLN